MAMSISKPGVHIKWMDWFFWTVIFLIFITCVILLGDTFRTNLLDLIRAVARDPLASPASSSQPGLDAVTLQLAERVRDGNAFLDTTVKLMGVLATLLGLALGLSIWKTSDYAQALMKEHFLCLKTGELEPVIENSRKELLDLSNEGTKVILRASDLLLSRLSQEFLRDYEKVLEHKGVPLDDRNILVKKEEDSVQTSQEITQYLIASLSRDEETVVAQCQNLSAMVKRQDFDVSADLIVNHLSKLVTVWGPGTSARTEIIRLLDQIKTRKQASK